MQKIISIKIPFKFTVPRTNINLDIERLECLISSKALIGFPKIKNIPL